MTNRYKFCDHCGAKIILGNDCEKCKADIKKQRNAYQRNFYNENKDTQKTIKSRKWQKFRSLIIQRDKGVCQRCLALKNVANNEQLQVHHIKPRTKYPELVFEESNVITVCKDCNLELGTKEVLDFKPLFNSDSKQLRTFHL